MSKYFFVLKNAIQQRMIYRFSMLIFLASGLINFGVIFFFWGSVYRQGNQVGTYTFQEIVSYYFLAAFIAIIVRPDDKAWRISDEIRLGGFNNIMLRPINYFWFHFSQSLGSLLFTTVAYVPVMLGMIFFLDDSIGISGDFLVVATGIFSIFLAFVMNFIIFFTVGISAFYFGMVKGLNYSMFVISSFLSGGIVPLDIFPNFFMRISDLLPFKYLLYIPIGILSGRMQIESSFFVVPFVWIAILSGFSFLVFKYGIKRYEGSGA